MQPGVKRSDCVTEEFIKEDVHDIPVLIAGARTGGIGGGRYLPDRSQNFDTAGNTFMEDGSVMAVS